MVDNRLALMTGIDILVPECQISIHQPTIKELSYLGEDAFFDGIKLLTISKKDVGKFDLETIDNFQIFMTVITEKEAVDKKKVVIDLLRLLLPSYKIIFSPQSLILSSGEGVNITIDKDNFSFLQEALKKIFRIDAGKESEDSLAASFNPANKRAQEIAEKIMKGRQRVAEIQGEANSSIFSKYLSSLSIGLHIPVTQLREYTVYQLFDSIERYSLYLNWDIDIRSRMAGAKPDGKPENWMKNIQ